MPVALSWSEIRERLYRFSFEWKDCSGYEKGEAQDFLREFFNCFGISPRRFGSFECRIAKEGDIHGFADYLWKNKILIEMKSKGKNLIKAYDQARGYFPGLTDDELPQYIMVSDFDDFALYNLESGNQWVFSLSELSQNAELFGFIVGYQTHEQYEQDPVNIKAAEQMGRVYETLRNSKYNLDDLDIYIVRLIFCFFADDTRIFEPNQFYDYIKASKPDGADLAERMNSLFQVLDIPQPKRQTYLPEELRSFPYINGGLFQKIISTAYFTKEIRDALLKCASLDWKRVSPAIFGSLFQVVMSKIDRRRQGVHYTQEEYIMNIIKPLFLDTLYEEFEKCNGNATKLKQLNRRISQIEFLDPACGCGNFLIIAYRELRALEDKILKILLGREQVLNVSDYILCNIGQFHGIELDHFACEIARTGMWLMDHICNIRTAAQHGCAYIKLPLDSSADIRKDNALKCDWNIIIDHSRELYIFGNPPFIGKKYQNEDQKADMKYVFGSEVKSGNLDYVAAWFWKTAKYMNPNDRAAFIATSSIVQGEQVPVLMGPLFNKIGIHFDFAYKPFHWDSEAKNKAAVYIVIIGFSKGEKIRQKYIYENGMSTRVTNINQYLQDSSALIVESRRKPICEVKPLVYGSFALDAGGLYTISQDEYDEIKKAEPQSLKFLKPFLGSEEFINGIARYCVWLTDFSFSDLKGCPIIRKKVAAVQAWRETRDRPGTKAAALTPMLFAEIRQPNCDYLAIPITSSEKRKYIPIGFLSKEVIGSNHIFMLPEADLYDFAILTSSMHNAWMRAVAGRMKSDYNYSANIVYNNFPWPTPSDSLKQLIIEAASEVIHIRDKHGVCLKKLYEPMDMKKDLLGAHFKLDRLVNSAYRTKKFTSELEQVEHLFALYQDLIRK